MYDVFAHGLIFRLWFEIDVANTALDVVIVRAYYGRLVNSVHRFATSELSAAQ